MNTSGTTGSGLVFLKQYQWKINNGQYGGGIGCLIQLMIKCGWVGLQVKQS